MFELTEQTEFLVVFIFIFLGLATLYFIDRWLAGDEQEEEDE